MKCTIGEYKRVIRLKYGGYGESQIEIQTALCTLGEENLKEVCSGLKITLPPESKGRLVSI